MKRAFSAMIMASLLVSTWLPNTVSAATAAGKLASNNASPLAKIQSDPATGISEYRLKSNGLKVLLAERHATPIVTVMVVYHVGSRNEAVGYTGATHFLEHMMFKGTKEHDPLKGTGIDDVLKPIGGINNATTFYDRTNYYEIVPAQYLDTCLELEADRMRHALLRQSDRDSEMTVVRNELERNEDDASRLMDVNLFAHAFVAHPYHHPVIGWRSDVEGVPVERLRQFYNEFYYPNNATLVVTGDFKTQEALNLIAEYFSKVPASPRPQPRVYTVEPPQEGQRRFTVQHGQDLPKVVLGFHIPPATNKDTYALEVAASLLGDEKRQSSRLYKALVDKGLASDCYAYNYSLKDPGLFTLLATVTPDTKSEQVETALFDQAQQLAKEPVSDEELDKAKKAVWKRMKLEAADPVGMASQLAEAIAVADWKWWVNLEKNIKAVTREDVQAAAAKYFSKRNETVGYYLPMNKAGERGVPAEPTAEPGKASSSLLDVPATYVGAIAEGQTKQAIAASPPSVSRSRSIASQVQKRVLPNGLTVMVMPVPESGVVAVAGKILAGEYFATGGNRCVAELTADMLDKGSTRWNKEKLAQQLELMGTSLDFSTSNFWTDFNSDLVAEDLPSYLAMLSDTIEHPLFLSDELAKSKKQQSAEIQAAMADSGQVAVNAFYGATYKPSCVYYQQPFPEQLTDLNKVTSEDLKAFHHSHIVPGNTVLAIVGDVRPQEVFELVERNFANWKGSTTNKIDVNDCAYGKNAGKRITTNLADKTAVDVIMGSPAPVDIRSPDFCAASLANAALGHDTVSSRLSELRLKHGLTYGISSFFSENAFANGPWMIEFTVNPDNLNKSLPLVQSIIRRYIKDGITQAELDNEAKRLSGEYIIERMRTPRQLADALTKYEILGLGPKFMDEYAQRLKKVTRLEANAAIRKYFDPQKLVTSIAGSVGGTPTTSGDTATRK